MEENIHDDKMDDYVRRSFEGYEEEPSEDMWERVALDLPATPEPRPWFRRFAWQTLAAVVIFMLCTTLVCEHYYYEEKLKELAQKPHNTAAPLVNNHPVGDANKPETSLAIPSTANSDETNASSANSDKDNSKGASKANQADQHLEVPKAIQKQESRNLFTTPQSILPVSNQAQDTTIKAGISPPIANTPSPEALILLTQIDSTSETPGPPKPIVISWAPIPTSMLNPSGPILPVLTQIDIKPVKKSSGWYVGASTSWMRNIEKSQVPVSRPGRPAFLSKQEKTSSSRIGWITAGKKLSPVFSLETGVGYQKIVRQASHLTRFRFGDGIAQGGAPNNRRAYNYDLSTYGGTAEVSMRMEQTSQIPISDDEAIPLKITTNEQTELLRIPLLARYTMGTGRWQALAKVGLLGNIILKSGIEVSARTSQNPRFQPVIGSDGYTIQLDSKKFSLGYWLSAGAAFKYNQQLTLTAEPTLIGDFSRKDAFKRQLPQNYLVGVNFQALYSF